jgi:hypothetical protein
MNKRWWCNEKWLKSRIHFVGRMSRTGSCAEFGIKNGREKTRFY